MKSSIKYYIGIAVWLLLFVLAAWYFRAHRADFEQLLALGAQEIILLVALNMLSRVLVGVRLKFLTAPFGINLSVIEGTGLSIIQSYGNAVAIKGGTAGIAYYLYRAKKFSLDRFLAITGGGFILTSLVLSVAGLAGVALTSVGSNVGPEIPLIFSLFLAGALALLVFPKFRLPFSHAENFVNRIAEGWDVLRAHRWNIVKLVAVELAILFSFALRYFVAFRGFSQPIRLSQAFLLAPPAYMSLMVNVTPAGLGVREPILAYMSKILGYTVKGGLAAAVLDSAVMVAISLILGPIVTAIMMPRKEAGDAA